MVAMTLPHTLLLSARVSVTPGDVALLAASGNWDVRVESGAGQLSGFTSSDYSDAGAKVHPTSSNENEEYFQGLFKDASVICRCKRASRDREILEGKAFPKDVYLLGFIYLLNDTTPHVQEWLTRTKMENMIDLTQTDLPSSHPGNAISPMSALTGGLAVDDVLAMEKFHNSTGSNAPIVIIGAFGVVGKSSFQHLIKLQLDGTLQGRTIYLCGRESSMEALEARFAKETALMAGAEKVKESVVLMNTADFMQAELGRIHGLGQAPSIVIATARVAGEKSNKLITEEHLPLFADGCVFVDLAITEGGSVEHASGDVTKVYNCATNSVQAIAFSSEAGSAASNQKVSEVLKDVESNSLANLRFIHSVTGYPKRVPREASGKYSKVMMHYLANPPICSSVDKDADSAKSANAGDQQGATKKPRL